MASRKLLFLVIAVAMCRIGLAQSPTYGVGHTPTADEMRAILAKADEAISPALAIQAFAGLRLSEVSRLDWRDVRLAERASYHRCLMAATSTYFRDLAKMI